MLASNPLLSDKHFFYIAKGRLFFKASIKTDVNSSTNNLCGISKCYLIMLAIADVSMIIFSDKLFHVISDANIILNISSFIFSFRFVSSKFSFAKNFVVQTSTSRLAKISFNITLQTLRATCRCQKPCAF